MLDAESRKRPLLEEPEPLPAKKRALTDANGAPVLVNGVVAATPPAPVDDEPKEQDNLEQFRKEAIFRRMRYYSRENDRSQARIAELERLKGTYEAGFLAMGACWAQLIDTIRGLVKLETVDKVDVQTEDLFRLDVAWEPDSALADALEEKAKATRSLVTAFVQHGATLPLRDDLFKQYQKSQSECTALRTELVLTRAKLQESESLCEKYHSELVAAEVRVDRQQSRTVQAIMTHAPPPSTSAPVEGNEIKTEEGNAPSKQELPVALPVVLDPHLQDSLFEARARIATLEAAEQILQEQIRALREAPMNVLPFPPTKDQIRSYPDYKYLEGLKQELKNAMFGKSDEVTRLQDEVRLMSKTRKEFEEEMTKLCDRSTEELRVALTKRDSENSRLRETREKQAAELLERKQVESFKRQSVEQLQLLADSRAERVQILQSEVTRLKGFLAAHAGDEDLATFLATEKSGDVIYVDDLKARLEHAEGRVTSLESQLSFFEEDHPDVVRHMRSEAEARQQLADAANRLKRYQDTYGEMSTLPPDVQQLSEQLGKKDAEIRNLRLQEKQRNEADAPLYAEFDRLESAWKKLDGQVNGRVVDLSAAEERVRKVTLEKAKLENKFYAAMRDNAALDNKAERHARTLDMQNKLMENLKEKDALLEARLADLETQTREQQRTIHEKTELQVSLQKKLDGEVREKQRMRANDADREVVLQKIRKDHAAEVALWTKKYHAREKRVLELEAEKDMLKAHPAVPASQKESALQKEVDKCMSILKCSTCRINMRSTVLSKCLHTFCKQCIDARVATRQRKCPACNLAFAQSDVQQIFFQ